MGRMQLPGGDPCREHMGFVTVGVDKFNRSHLAFQARDSPDQPQGPFSSWELRQSDPRFAVFWQNLLQGSKSGPILYPYVSVDQNPSAADIYHVAGRAENNGGIFYWRFDGTTWQGPALIDSSQSYSHILAADPSSDHVALIINDDIISPGNPNGLRQVSYYESVNNGASWIDGTELGPSFEHFVTAYNSIAGPRSLPEATAAFDFAGDLHIIWPEQRVLLSTIIALKHWDKFSGTISTITIGEWGNGDVGGVGASNLPYPSLAVGNGWTTCTAGPSDHTNRNYLYLTYTQFGGATPAEMADSSVGGYMNGEIYLTVSNNGGLSWSQPLNLTNTKTPNCDPASGDSCASEHWGSIARIVDDTIHLFYVADRDAGSAPLGEGSWTFNPMMYYRIPGGADSPLLCPNICDCSHQGDVWADGVIDVFDVVKAIDCAFTDDTCALEPHPNCPMMRVDVNCDGVLDVFDIIRLIDYAFAGGAAPCNPCAL